MRHTLSILVENHFGELSRIVELFSARGYNIESLTVAETLEPGISHITLVTDGNDHTIERIVKQVDKQVRVLRVVDVSTREHVKREMSLIRVNTNIHPSLRQILSLVCSNQWRLIEVAADGMTIEATGDSTQITAMLENLRALGHCDMVRTGPVALTSVPELSKGGTAEPGTVE